MEMEKKIKLLLKGVKIANLSSFLYDKSQLMDHKLSEIKMVLKN